MNDKLKEIYEDYFQRLTFEEQTFYQFSNVAELTKGLYESLVKGRDISKEDIEKIKTAQKRITSIKQLISSNSEDISPGLNYLVEKHDELINNILQHID